MPNSLFGRLLAASLILLCIFFSFLYFAIQQSYLDSLLTAKQDQLQLQTYILVSTAHIEDDTIALPDELGEPRFDLYKSGLYGYVSDSNNTVLWASYSAHDMSVDSSLLSTNKLNSTESSTQNPVAGDSVFRMTADYYIAHYYVEWELIDEQPQLLSFTVLEDSAPTLEKIAEFQYAILRWFIAGALSFVVALLVILRWGTAPLNKLAQAIKDIESGKRQHIEGDFPVELQGLSNNLNALIDAEKQQRERYHNSLADLAHSLKTPLAVIQNELGTQRQYNNDESKALIAAQSARMKDIIAHQLQRAVVIAPSHLRDNTAVEDCVSKIASALSKVYRDKNIAIEQQIKPATIFKGDQRDLMEILGNLCDNACKACTGNVKICAFNQETTGTINKAISETTGKQTERLFIEVHDDGPGIAENLRDDVLKRGQRLDTTLSGQGIGLDVVRDIVELYDGEMSIEQSPLGGALFKVSFAN